MSALAAVVGDLRQVASVRRIVLDDGPERGVRALAFSTGGGLDFWVLSDRSLDIGPLWWKGTQLGWQAPGGFRSPSLTDLEGDGGRGFNRSFSGFLVTCGLDHTRQPDEQHPLHGRLPFTPARVTAYGEDWQAAAPILYVEGEVIQARLGGEALRLRRRIEAPIGGATITVHDTVENLGTDASPQAMLYHFNLGYPAIAPRTVVTLDGHPVLGPMELPARRGPEVPRCISVGNAKRADVAVVTSSGDGETLTTLIDFDAETLPFVQFWHDLRPRTGVIAIEPCTSRRLDKGRSAPDVSLEPGEIRQYRLSIRLAGQAAAIREFIGRSE